MIRSLSLTVFLAAAASPAVARDSLPATVEDVSIDAADMLSGLLKRLRVDEDRWPKTWRGPTG